MKTQEELLAELLEEIKEARRYVEGVYQNSIEIKRLVVETLEDK